MWDTSEDEAVEIAQRRSRLTKAEDRPRCYPWTRASAMECCQLYWLPVTQFPAGFLQRRWLLRFQELFSTRMAEKSGLVPELFVEMKYLSGELRSDFIKTSREFFPMFGLGRHPKRPLPPPVDDKYIDDLQKGRTTFDIAELQPDYCYWFLRKQATTQRNLFFGVGGMFTLYLTPGEAPPKIQKPRLGIIHDPKMRKMVADADLDGMAQQVHSLSSPFLKQSKEMFASDLADMPEYPGLLFAVPLLGSQDFFDASPGEVEQWFSLFSAYLRESPEDRGVILAAKDDIEEDLEAITTAMTKEGLDYAG